MPKKKSKLPLLRTIVQACVFAAIFLGGSVAALAKKGINIPFPAFEVHGVCPLGGAETMYTLLTSGNFIQKTQPSSVVLFVIVAVITLLFGAVFCGWFCPFGTFQEFIGKLGKRLFPRLYNRIPRAIDRPLRFLRYVALAALLVITARVGKMVFESIDPYAALMNILSDEVAVGGLVALGIVAAASLFIERPFCKYLCPYGAILGVLSLASLFRPRRVESTCISCKACDKACPMNIRVASKKAVRDHQCISCYRCTSDESCPVPNTLVVASPGMKDVGAHQESKGVAGNEA